MQTASAVSITVSVYSVILLFMGTVWLSTSGYFRKELKRSLILMMYAGIVVNLGDVFAYGFSGDTSPFGLFVIKAANVAVFFGNYLSLWFFAGYLYHRIKDRADKECTVLRNIAWAMSGVGMIVLIISRIFGFCYSIDAEGHYQREKGYIVLILFAEITLLCILIFIIRTWKKLVVWEKIAYSSVVAFPVIGTVIQLGLSDISLSTISGNLSVFVIYLMHMFEYVYQFRATLTYNRLIMAKVEGKYEDVAQRLVSISASVQKHRHRYFSEEKAAQRFGLDITDMDLRGPGERYFPENVIRELGRLSGECGSAEGASKETKARLNAINGAAEYITGALEGAGAGMEAKRLKNIMEKAAELAAKEAEVSDKGTDSEADTKADDKEAAPDHENESPLHREGRRSLSLKELQKADVKRVKEQDFVMQVLFGGLSDDD